MPRRNIAAVSSQPARSSSVSGTSRSSCSGVRTAWRICQRQSRHSLVASPRGRGCAPVRPSASVALFGGLQASAACCAPPLLAGLGQRVDRVVVLVLRGRAPRVRQLDAGAVVLRPVRDALLAVVLGDLVHPALPDEGHVADDARRREARQVPHDVVLELLRLRHRDPPVLGVGDHVAHVEVVRQDLRVVEQREAQLEQVLRRGVHAAQQHALVAHVAEAHLEQLLRGLAPPAASPGWRGSRGCAAPGRRRARTPSSPAAPAPASTLSWRKCWGMPISPFEARRMSRMFSMSSSALTNGLQLLDRAGWPCRRPRPPRRARAGVGRR